MDKRAPRECSACGQRIRKKRCKISGPFDTREQLRQAIEARLRAGKTGRSIALELGISEPTVSRIRNGDLPQTESGLPIKASIRLHENRNKAVDT